MITQYCKERTQGSADLCDSKINLPSTYTSKVLEGSRGGAGSLSSHNRTYVKGDRGLWKLWFRGLTRNYCMNAKAKKVLRNVAFCPRQQMLEKKVEIENTA